MKLRTRTVELALALVFIVSMGMFASTYIHERDRVAQQKGYDSAMRVVEQKAQDAVTKAQADTKAAVADLEKEKQRKLPTTTVIREIPRYIPIGPIATVPSGVPDAPSALLTAPQLDGLRTFGIACQECSAERDGLKKELEAQRGVTDAERSRREAAEKALHGGTWRQRLVRDAKCLGITSAAAGLGGLVKGWEGAAVGAGGGFVLCHL